MIRSAALLVAAAIHPPADTLWLENRTLRLGFDPRNGSLVAFTDRATGETFAGAGGGNGGTDLWRLDRLHPADSSVFPTSARGFSWRRLAGEQQGLTSSGATSGSQKRRRCA